MIVLCTSGFVQVAAVGVFTLTQEGERTPDILYATLVRYTRSTTCMLTPFPSHTALLIMNVVSCALGTVKS